MDEQRKIPGERYWAFDTRPVPEIVNEEKLMPPAEIIESASRPIKDLNDRLTEAGFMEWYEETKGGEESPK